MKKFHLKHLWYVLAAYGVWFAMFSGMEEISKGKYWKAIASLLLGVIVYWIIEEKLKK